MAPSFLRLVLWGTVRVERENDPELGLGGCPIPQGEKVRERGMSGTRQDLVREWSGAAEPVFRIRKGENVLPVL